MPPTFTLSLPLPVSLPLPTISYLSASPSPFLFPTKKSLFGFGISSLSSFANVKIRRNSTFAFSSLTQISSPYHSHTREMSHLPQRTQTETKINDNDDANDNPFSAFDEIVRLSRHPIGEREKEKKKAEIFPPLSSSPSPFPSCSLSPSSTSFSFSSSFSVVPIITISGSQSTGKSTLSRKLHALFNSRILEKIKILSNPPSSIPIPITNSDTDTFSPPIDILPFSAGKSFRDLSSKMGISPADLSKKIQISNDKKLDFLIENETIKHLKTQTENIKIFWEKEREGKREKEEEKERKAQNNHYTDPAPSLPPSPSPLFPSINQSESNETPNNIFCSLILEGRQCGIVSNYCVERGILSPFHSDLCFPQCTPLVPNGPNSCSPILIFVLIRIFLFCNVKEVGMRIIKRDIAQRRREEKEKERDGDADLSMSRVISLIENYFFAKEITSLEEFATHLKVLTQRERERERGLSVSMLSVIENISETFDSLHQRDQTDRLRYLSLYGSHSLTDSNNMNNYDCVIDTTRNTEEQTWEMAKEKIFQMMGRGRGRGNGNGKRNSKL